MTPRPLPHGTAFVVLAILSLAFWTVLAMGWAK